MGGFLFVSGDEFGVSRLQMAGTARSQVPKSTHGAALS